MSKYRKKPVVIEAQQFLPGSSDASDELPFAKERVCCLGPEGWYVETLEGNMHISDGDWIIRGVKGEYYPCKPDIFEATYEKVEAKDVSD